MTIFDGLEHVVREQEPLAPYTRLHLGGPAEYFAEPTNVQELADLVKRCHQNDVPIRLIGGGSRVLISDQGVPGVVVLLSAPEFCNIVVRDDRVTAGGGAKLGHVISSAVREGLAGLESLVGIPGTVAGAVRGNADSHGSSIGQWTHQVTVMTREGEVVQRTRDELRFSYRESSLDELAILEAQFQLEKRDSVELTRRMQKLWIVKRASEPSADVATGRIFKDSQGFNAAQLIEQAGLRGAQVGKAQVSESCANYIVANAGATSQDVTDLIEMIKTRVKTELGVSLECEIQIW